jgi:hypothetical protein
MGAVLFFLVHKKAASGEAARWVKEQQLRM